MSVTSEKHDENERTNNSKNSKKSASSRSAVTTVTSAITTSPLNQTEDGGSSSGGGGGELVIRNYIETPEMQQQQQHDCLPTSHHSNTTPPSQPVHTEMLPPELRDLFEISSFVAHAKPAMKPCFRTRTYVTRDSWIGALFRRLHGESAMLGALQIQRIAERLSSSLHIYRGKIWEPTIKSHLTDFLRGVRIIQETYSDYTEVTPILSTSILTIEHSLSSSSASTVQQQVQCGTSQQQQYQVGVSPPVKIF